MPVVEKGHQFTTNCHRLIETHRNADSHPLAFCLKHTDRPPLVLKIRAVTASVTNSTDIGLCLVIKEYSNLINNNTSYNVILVVENSGQMLKR